MKTLISEIQRFSIHDGPGIRTTVFFKGCPLHCAWCHNPECISFEAQELFYPEKCISCQKCAEGCYAGARVLCGRALTSEQVLEEILPDVKYYGTNGGVTLSGGEPLAHPAFARELIKLCKQAGIGCAMETSLFYWEEDILSELCCIMADIKLMEDQKHREYTGAGNRSILENIRRADTLGIPMLLRTPVIPGVNDSRENLSKTADFVRSLKNAVSYELLPYHPLGLSKARALGIEMTEFQAPSRKAMEQLRSEFSFRKTGGNLL